MTELPQASLLQCCSVDHNLPLAWHSMSLADFHMSWSDQVSMFTYFQIRYIKKSCSIYSFTQEVNDSSL